MFSVREYAEILRVKKHQPADTTAQIFWSKNRRPDLWRDVKKIDSEPEQIKQAYTGEALLAKLRERGLVEIEGEYRFVEEQDKSNQVPTPPELRRSPILRKFFPN